MAAEMLVQLVQRSDVRVGEKRGGAGLLQHIYEDQVLPSNQLNVAHEAFGQQRIVQRSKENQQRASSQAQPQESAKLVVIRRYDSRFERVERIPAIVVMGLAVFGPDEVVNFVGEGEQPEQIPLLFGRESQDQSGGDEAFEDRGTRIEARRLKLVRSLPCLVA